jgi:hypothetical protein
MKNQWENVCDTISQDAKENWDRIQSDDSQLNRRNYVRSIFALYEASLGNLRERVGKILIEEFEATGEWRLHEFIPLLDELPQITRNGKLNKEPNKVPFVSLVAYVLKTYSDLISFEGNILGDHGWELFCKSVKIRHRIIHPKRENDFEISDEDLKFTEEARLWWNDIWKKLWQAHEAHLTHRCSGPHGAGSP